MMRVLSIIVALLAAGCVARTYTPAVRYELPARIQVDQHAATGYTVAVRPLDIARPYGAKMVYRIRDHVLVPYEDAEWSELPRESITRALSDALRSTGGFADVADAVAVSQPDIIVSGEVRRLYQDRTQTPWRAHCEIRVEARMGIERRSLWVDTIVEETVQEADSMAAFAPAMGSALGAAVSRAADGIASAAVGEATRETNEQTE